MVIKFKTKKIFNCVRKSELSVVVFIKLDRFENAGNMQNFTSNTTEFQRVMSDVKSVPLGQTRTLQVNKI